MLARSASLAAPGGRRAPSSASRVLHRARHERLGPLLVEEEVAARLAREGAQRRLVGEQVVERAPEAERRVDVARLDAGPDVREQARRLTRAPSSSDRGAGDRARRA